MHILRTLSKDQNLRSVAPKSCFQIFILTTVTQTNSTVQQNTHSKTKFWRKTHEFYPSKTIIREWKHGHEHVECKNSLSDTETIALDSPVSEAFFATASLDGTSAATGAGARAVSGFDCSSGIAVGLLESWIEKQNTEAEWGREKQRKCYYLYYIQKFQETWWTLNKVIVSQVFNYFAP